MLKTSMIAGFTAFLITGCQPTSKEMTTKDPGESQSSMEQAAASSSLDSLAGVYIGTWTKNDSDATGSICIHIDGRSAQIVVVDSDDDSTEYEWQSDATADGQELTLVRRHDGAVVRVDTLQVDERSKLTGSYTFKGKEWGKTSLERTNRAKC